MTQFLKQHLWPFWGLAKTSPQSNELQFDEKGNFISSGPSTYNDHIVRFANRKTIKERGGFRHYLINWIVVALLFLITGSLFQSGNQIIYFLLMISFIASSIMAAFLLLLYRRVDKNND